MEESAGEWKAQVYRCVWMYLPARMCIYWHGSKLICLFPLRSCLFFFLTWAVTTLWGADVKRNAGSDECSVHHSYSAIVFMNFWLFFSLLGNLVCNPTGYKLRVIFNLPERTGAHWRYLRSDVLSKNRPGLLAIRICLFIFKKPSKHYIWLSKVMHLEKSQNFARWSKTTQSSSCWCGSHKIENCILWLSPFSFHSCGDAGADK